MTDAKAASNGSRGVWAYTTSRSTRRNDVDYSAQYHDTLHWLIGLTTSSIRHDQPPFIGRRRL